MAKRTCTIRTLLAPKRPDNSAVTSSRSLLNALPIDQIYVIFTRIITMIDFWSNYQKKNVSCELFNYSTHMHGLTPAPVVDALWSF